MADTVASSATFVAPVVGLVDSTVGGVMSAVVNVQVVVPAISFPAMSRASLT